MEQMKSVKPTHLYLVPKICFELVTKTCCLIFLPCFQQHFIRCQVEIIFLTSVRRACGLLDIDDVDSTER